MGSTGRRRLCAMFFLEYFIKGAWLPLLGLYMGRDYLGFTGAQQAWVFNAFAIASITGMFFGGQLADRYVAQERFLAASHLGGGLAILGLAYVKSFWPFFGLMLLHCFFYVPTLSVANAIAFAHLGEDRKRFGLNLIDTVRHNVSAASLGSLSRGGVVRGIVQDPAGNALRFAQPRSR